MSDWIPNQGAAGLWATLLGALIVFVVRVEVGLARLKSGHEAMWKTRAEDMKRHEQDETRRDNERAELRAELKELTTKIDTLSNVVLMAIKKD